MFDSLCAPAEEFRNFEVVKARSDSKIFGLVKKGAGCQGSCKAAFAHPEFCSFQTNCKL